MEAKEKRVSKGTAEREATKSRDAYRASVAADLSMHHRVIGELVQQVTGLIERVKKLEDDKPKIQVVGSL